MTTSLEQQKYALKTEYLYSHALNIGAGNLIAALVLAAIYWTLLSSATVLLWLLAVIAVLTQRMYAANAFRRRNRYVSSERWYKHYANSVLINGCLWGLISTVIAHQCSAEQLPYMLMVSGALVASCCISNSALFSVFNRFATPALLPPGLYLLTQVGTDKFLMGVLLLCWFVLMYSTAWRFNKFLSRSLGFEFENVALLRQLEAEKQRNFAIREDMRLQDQIIKNMRAANRGESVQNSNDEGAVRAGNDSGLRLVDRRR